MCMSIIGCITGIGIFHMYILAAILEGQLHWDWGNGYAPGCRPGFYDSFIPYCAKSEVICIPFQSLPSPIRRRDGSVVEQWSYNLENQIEALFLITRSLGEYLKLFIPWLLTYKHTHAFLAVR